MENIPEPEPPCKFQNLLCGHMAYELLECFKTSCTIGYDCELCGETFKCGNDLNYHVEYSRTFYVYL